MNKKTTKILVTLVSIIIFCSIVITAIIIKTNKVSATTENITAETALVEDNASDNITIDDNGNVVNKSTGKKLSKAEINNLKDKGVITEDDKGNIKVEATTETITEAKNTTDSKNTNDSKNTKNNDSKNNDSKNNTETTTETKTESKPETTTESKTESKQEKTTESKTESTTENNTTEQPFDELPDETFKPVECSHNWVWKTHTVHHDAVTKEEEYISGYREWDEAIYVDKVQCDHGKIFNTPEEILEDHYCGGYIHVDIFDHYEHHKDPLYDTRTVVVKEAYDEVVKDYEYCSSCGQRK